MKMKTAFKTAEGKAAVLGFYNGLLDNLPFPVEKITVNTRHGGTFALACGDPAAPPLVLLHGSGSNSLMWLGDAATYARQYRVIMPDIPGEPGNSADTQLPLNGAAYAEWLHDVAAELGISRMALVGLSLGGWMALKFATAYPERVDRLVLLCPAGIRPPRLSFLISGTVQRLIGEKAGRKLYGKVLGGQQVPEAVLEFQRLIGLHFNYRRERLPIFSDRELKRLEMPVSLFAGDRDVIFPTARVAGRVRAALPHAAVTVLPGAGHTLILMAGQIMPFLR